jgi:hypothetical protein
VSAPRDFSERLLRLEQILAASGGSRGAAPNGDAAELLLASVMTERIRKTTAELDRDAPMDAAEALAMRLLLADYGAAVGQLRGVARIAERRLTDVADVMRNCKRDVERASG